MNVGPNNSKRPRLYTWLIVALAVVLLACGLAAASQIWRSDCAKFETEIGYSATRLLGFKCEAALAADKSEVSREALAAPTLSGKKGYVSYRVDNGVARSSGSLMPSDGSSAPEFSKVKEGQLLTATQSTELKERPFLQSLGHMQPLGQCYSVLAGTRVADEEDAAGRSGGWLPVETVACSKTLSAARAEALQTREQVAAKPTAVGTSTRLPRETETAPRANNPAREALDADTPSLTASQRLSAAVSRMRENMPRQVGQWLLISANAEGEKATLRIRRFMN